MSFKLFRLTYIPIYLSACDPHISVIAKSAAVNSETKIVPNVATIMPASVAEQVFAAELVNLVNGVTTPEQFCNNLTVAAEDTK